MNKSIDTPQHTPPLLEAINKRLLFPFEDKSSANDMADSAECNYFGDVIRIVFPNVFTDTDIEADGIEYFETFLITVAPDEEHGDPNKQNVLSDDTKDIKQVIKVINAYFASHK